jgi:ketosteroid isomerase-like protein
VGVIRDSGRVPGKNAVRVKAGLEALNRGDIEEQLTWVDPAFRFDMTERVFNPDVYEGHEGLRRFNRDLSEVWEEFQLEVEDLLESESGGTVVALYRMRGRGKGSGVEVELESATVWEFRDDKAVSARIYRDRDAAFAAAGIST